MFVTIPFSLQHLYSFLTILSLFIQISRRPARTSFLQFLISRGTYSLFYPKVVDLFIVRGVEIRGVETLTKETMEPDK